MRKKLLTLSAIGLLFSLSSNAQVYYRQLLTFNSIGDTSACITLKDKPNSRLCDMIEKEVANDGNQYFVYYQGDSTLAFVTFRNRSLSDTTKLGKPMHGAYWLDEHGNLTYADKMVKVVNKKKEVYWISAI